MSLAVLAVLVVVTLLGRRAVASPILGRLRALFPSWRFFDRALASPELLVRFGAADALGAWTAIDQLAAPPGLGRWAFAPSSNLALAYHAVVEQLVAELGELELEDTGAAGTVERDPQVVDRVSYELVTRVARAHVPAGAQFQWKIRVPGEPADYLLSPVFG